MSAEHSITSAAAKIGGKAEEAFGKVTDNDRLVAEGSADQVKGHLNTVASDVEDSVEK
ncbi:CsbD family protein [Microbacterium ulmi]|uniref:CsbD family protein n=1 Tax=Microbacterium ulmi TaxID=179095 RepID=A0A7Y2M077_9MICO|nr:CsbD family protein [Microbacterium ulmi]NII70699.1 uncharacterized protein YjbJ (UPF0337 family) [Microbacterium ulmi]NNH02718.1 CsbD family protein [Microbacterium ulmi]